MGLLNWMFDIYQHDQIAQVRRKQTNERWEVLEELAATRTETAAIRSANGAVDSDRLAEAIGELALGIKALQRILVDKGIVTAEELTATMKIVDLQDGVEDGKTTI